MSKQIEPSSIRIAITAIGAFGALFTIIAFGGYALWYHGMPPNPHILFSIYLGFGIPFLLSLFIPLRWIEGRLNKTKDQEHNQH